MIHLVWDCDRLLTSAKGVQISKRCLEGIFEVTEFTFTEVWLLNARIID